MRNVFNSQALAYEELSRRRAHERPPAGMRWAVRPLGAMGWLIALEVEATPRRGEQPRLPNT